MHIYVFQRAKCNTSDLGSGMAESHKGVMKIVAEYEICA